MKEIPLLLADIEKTMHTLDNVLSFYHTAKDVEATIKEGPAASDLETYMSYLEKVLKAKKYFDTHSPNSKELKEIAEGAPQVIKWILIQRKQPVIWWPELASWADGKIPRVQRSPWKAKHEEVCKFYKESLIVAPARARKA
ncbi:exocyst complex component 7, partial [Plakobranchus ocellatus]